MFIRKSQTTEQISSTVATKSQTHAKRERNEPVADKSICLNTSLLCDEQIHTELARLSQHVQGHPTTRNVPGQREIVPTGRLTV